MTHRLSLTVVVVLGTLLILAALFQSQINALPQAAQDAVFILTFLFVGVFLVFAFWRDETAKDRDR